VGKTRGTGKDQIPVMVVRDREGIPQTSSWKSSMQSMCELPYCR